MIFAKDTRVKIVGIPSLENVTGLVKGVGVRPLFGLKGSGSYIIEVDADFREKIQFIFKYDYDCVNITDACVERI